MTRSFLDETAEGGFCLPRGPPQSGNHVPSLAKSLTIALQPLGLHDAVTMLAAGAEMGGEGTEEASYTDLERLVRSVGHMPRANE